MTSSPNSWTRSLASPALRSPADLSREHFVGLAACRLSRLTGSQSNSSLGSRLAGGARVGSAGLAAAYLTIVAEESPHPPRCCASALGLRATQQPHPRSYGLEASESLIFHVISQLLRFGAQASCHSAAALSSYGLEMCEPLIFHVISQLLRFGAHASCHSCLLYTSPSPRD